MGACLSCSSRWCSCCFNCFEAKNQGDIPEHDKTEVANIVDGNAVASSEDCHQEADVQISKEMSAPTISIECDESGGSEGRVLKGHGLALAASAITGNSYFEWHIQGGNKTGEEQCMFGISMKRSPQFYDVLMKSEGAGPLKMATKQMRKVATSSICIVGVAIAVDPYQSEEPFVQLFHNGVSVEKFKLKSKRLHGSIYPAIWVPSWSSSSEVGNEEIFSAIFVHDKAHFQHQPPQNGFSFMPLSYVDHRIV